MKTKGAVLWGLGQEWSIEEIEIGDPVAGEVQIQLETAGMCHSDHHIVTGATPMPSFPVMGGHEGAGVITKLGPGVPKEIIPDGVQAAWVSESHDVVEASLWNRLPAGPAAVVLSEGRETIIHRPVDAGSASGGEASLDAVLAGAGQPGRGGLPVRPLGRYLIEPDGAVVRAGLFEELAPAHDVWLLDPHIAYLSADEPLFSPLVTCFEVREVLDYDRKALRRWVAERGVGTLEIKKRGIDVDPAALRRELRPKGKASATLVLARTVDATLAIVVERSGQGVQE